ncbi:hypothetical protein BU16DRAFT_544611 [Lophium mytilinum]|uniref:Uncharacterized protein n=1 Tax=Lophium mytilinum TaxID=390894 RepID=A0A6A6QA39_9PEZI|nr:hypothetical protein BU16DRAFT_544611 [Lophium mytilinum]
MLKMLSWDAGPCGVLLAHCLVMAETSLANFTPQATSLDRYSKIARTLNFLKSHTHTAVQLTMSQTIDFDTEAARYLHNLLHTVLLEITPKKITAAWAERLPVIQDGHQHTADVIRVYEEEGEEWQMPADIDAEAARALLESNQCDDAPVILGSIIAALYGIRNVEVLTLRVYPRLYTLNPGDRLSPRRVHTVLRIGDKVLDLTAGQFGFKWLLGPEREYRDEFVVEGPPEVCIPLQEAWEDMPSRDGELNAVYNSLRIRLKREQDSWLRVNGETLRGVVMGEDEEKRRDLWEKLRVIAERVWQER